MKKYEKPTLSVVQLKVSENIAAKGNTTIYNLSNLENSALGILGLDGES